MTTEKQLTAGMPKTFASKAYLREVDRGTYMLYRNIEVEYFSKEKGQDVREKVKEICVSPLPLREFDPKVDDERSIVLETFHPEQMRPMRLVEVEPR